MTEHEKLMDFERRLCERLDIPAECRVCVCGCSEYAHENQQEGCLCECEQFRLAWNLYPAVSRTGDGLLALVDAIQSRGLPWGLEDLQEGLIEGCRVRAYCCLESCGDVASALAPTLPLALALAAAKAFGVEVPQ